MMKRSNYALTDLYVPRGWHWGRGGRVLRSEIADEVGEGDFQGVGHAFRHHEGGRVESPLDLAEVLAVGSSHARAEFLQCPAALLALLADRLAEGLGDWLRIAAAARHPGGRGGRTCLPQPRIRHAVSTTRHV